MNKILLLSSIVLLYGCSLSTGSSSKTNNPPAPEQPAATSGESDGFFTQGFLPGSKKSDLVSSSPKTKNSTPIIDHTQVTQDYYDAISSPEISLSGDPIPVPANHVNKSSPSKSDAVSLLAEEITADTDTLYDYYANEMILAVKSNESLKKNLNQFLTFNGYKLVWDTEYDVFFENDMFYDGDDIFSILKHLAEDISETGMDIHINVYMGNSVVLVYSVRS